MIASVCVYCSSSAAVDREFLDEAEAFGKGLARNGMRLVWGGAHVGLMGRVAEGVKKEQGHVTGVILDAFALRGLSFDAADTLISVPTMSERKTKMIEHAEAFVALPGGFGTLDELTEVLTLAQLAIISMPIVIVNTKGFYAPFIAQLERTYEMGFADVSSRALYHVAKNADDALAYLREYTPPSNTRSWEEKLRS